MTVKFFWQDPYLTQLATRITSRQGNEITVAETIFYAFSGGQESDAGTIGGRQVREARKHGKEIIYTLDDAGDLQSGDPVMIEIDRERRYALMRLHFAAEIVLELVGRHLPQAEKIGAHIAQDKARIDFACGENIAPLLPQILEEAHAIIRADHPITSTYTDEANERRCWEITGFARVACGGTHIRSSAEVGMLALKRRNVGKNKERIEISLAAAL